MLELLKITCCVEIPHLPWISFSVQWLERIETLNFEVHFSQSEYTTLQIFLIYAFEMSLVITPPHDQSTGVIT